MKMSNSHQARRVQRTGLSLVEVLLAVAITAALLTAAAAAFMATSSAIEHNERFFRAAQGARVGVNRIMADVRRCEAGVVDPDSLELTLPDGEKRLYLYDSVNKRLTLTFPDAATPTAHVLARNVTSAEFRTDDKAVSLVLNIEYGSNKVSLSGSATPRRLVAYH